MAKAICPLCGLMRNKRSIKQHQNTRPCRSAQVVHRMRERGLVPLPTLEWAKLLKWANLPYERVPANGQAKYRCPGAWGAKHRRRLFRYIDGYSDPLYKDLGDVLFVEEWVDVVLRHPKAPPINDAKARLMPFVGMLQAIQKQDTEFKQALVTTHALGGSRAVTVMLAAEGLWALNK